MDNETIINSVDSTSVSQNDSKKIIKHSFYTDNTLDFASPFQKGDSIVYVYPPSTKDYRRLGYNTALYIGVGLISFGIIYTLPETTTKLDKQQINIKTVFEKWKANVKEGPAVDTDPNKINYIAHPYCGAVYYMTARGCGFSILESFSYAVLMSTFFWEYGIEAFAQIPSTQDLFVTPIIGSIVGEGFFHIKKEIVKNNKEVLNSRFLGITTLLILDPFNTVLDGLGYQQKVKIQTNITPVGFNNYSNQTIWGVDFTARF